MSTILDQLRSLKSGKSRRIKGQLVVRDDDKFIVDDERYSIDDAASKLNNTVAPKGIDYDRLAFLECPPYSCRVITTHRCRDKSEHLELIQNVIKRKNYLWIGSIQKDGKKYSAHPPFVIEWETIPEHPAEVQKHIVVAVDPKKWDRGLSCPFCGVEVSSTAGRTLHVKANHLEQFAEYTSLLSASHTPVKKPVDDFDDDDDDDDDDVVSQMNQSKLVSGLCCPFCDQKVGSTPGRTMHVKNKHADKLDDYRKMVADGTI